MKKASNSSSGKKLMSMGGSNTTTLKLPLEEEDMADVLEEEALAEEEALVSDSDESAFSVSLCRLQIESEDLEALESRSDASGEGARWAGELPVEEGTTGKSEVESLARLSAGFSGTSTIFFMGDDRRASGVR